MSDTSREAWQQLGAGKELDRVVAEALGWIVKPSETVPSLYSMVIRPNGHGAGMIKTGANYGDYVVVQGQGWPDYSTSADAALTLRVDATTDWKCIEYYDKGEWWYEVRVDNWQMHLGWVERGTDYALTRVRAWLAWRTAEPDRP